MSKQVVECPKCLGRGYFEVFGHVANGVCFCCKGQKTISVDIEAKKLSLSETTRRKADWIMASTEDSYAGLSYERLAAIRNFAHSGFGLQDAYPEILSHYYSVGEWAFQAAQEQKRAALYV
jgi:hypothetical protein